MRNNFKTAQAWMHRRIGSSAVRIIKYINNFLYRVQSLWIEYSSNTISIIIIFENISYRVLLYLIK